MLRTVLNQLKRGLASSSSQSVIKCRRLEGKIAIVTASTQGIGLAVARRFGQEGAKVLVSSRKEANVKNAVEQLKAEGLEVAGITCHIGKSEDRDRLLNEAKSRYGGLDILVSNAATNPEAGPAMKTSESAWDKIFDINVKSTFMLMKESIPLLKKSNKLPSIIITSSIAAYYPLSLFGAYAISKSTLLALCRVAAEELAMDGIRVNCVAPGIIKTKFSHLMYDSESAHKASMSLIPFRRLGTCEEIAAVTAFLASADASYITGETIVAAGGSRSRL